MLAEPISKAQLLKSVHHGSVTSARRPEFLRSRFPRSGRHLCGLHNRYGIPPGILANSRPRTSALPHRLKRASLLPPQGKTVIPTPLCGW